MPERDTRPPALHLPPLFAGDDAAKHFAGLAAEIQRWGEEMNDWVNDNLASTVEQVELANLSDREPNFLKVDSVAEQSRPEWLPDDFKARVRLMVDNWKCALEVFDVGVPIENLVTASYNEHPAGRPSLEGNKEAVEGLLGDVQRRDGRIRALRAERDETEQARQLVLLQVKEEIDRANKAIQERDAARHFSDLHKQQRNDYYQRAARAEKDSAKWEKAQKDEYALVRKALDKIEAAGGPTVGNIIARIDHLIAARDEAEDRCVRLAANLPVAEGAAHSLRDRAEAAEAKVSTAKDAILRLKLGHLPELKNDIVRRSLTRIWSILDSSEGKATLAPESVWREEIDHLKLRAEAAEAKVARVEAQLKRWDSSAARAAGNQMRDATEVIRKALDGGE